MVLTFMMPLSIRASANFYSAFTEAGAKQTIKANQMAEIKHLTPAFSNLANQMSDAKQ